MVSRAEDPLFVLSMHVPYRSISARMRMMQLDNAVNEIEQQDRNQHGEINRHTTRARPRQYLTQRSQDGFSQDAEDPLRLRQAAVAARRGKPTQCRRDEEDQNIERNNL